MKIACASIFPDIIADSLRHSVIGKAQERGILQLVQVDIRDYTRDKHHRVDDIPYGGGVGMVFKPEPCIRAIRDHWSPGAVVIHPSPAAPRFDQNAARALAREPHLIFIASRYEGLDRRVVDAWVDCEFSLGDYVITGGELAASVMIDAIARLLPGTVGKADSVEQDSFFDGLLDYPHYTRPPDFETMRVPQVLLGGHHQKIDQWRRQEALKRTADLRPDLLEALGLDADTVCGGGGDGN